MSHLGQRIYAITGTTSGCSNIDLSDPTYNDRRWNECRYKCYPKSTNEDCQLAEWEPNENSKMFIGSLSYGYRTRTPGQIDSPSAHLRQKEIHHSKRKRFFRLPDQSSHFVRE
eukprot:scaffold163_cov168-Alexandrium_tamarense.AAC.1